MWEEHVSCLRVSKFCFGQLQQDSSSCGDSDLAKANIQLDDFPEDELLGSCRKIEEGNQSDACLQPSYAEELKKDLLKINLWDHPNLISEEMVKCMRKIFLCLSESSDISSKASSECLPSPSSPVGQMSPSLTSFSDSSFIPSKFQNPSSGQRKIGGLLSQVDTFNPYGVNGKPNWRDIGCYSMASEVSWMSVGQEQLEYASEALKGYRFLVEQLAMINPACMSGKERLAFWINLYNALIMHAYLAYGFPKSDINLFSLMQAYLAYGFPKSDINLFSLMQKASYVVGGQPLSAAEIEFVILKMKPPGHRPQLISEEHEKYCIDSPQPLVLFALGCGMYSSPAIMVFKADNIEDELHYSMRNYIRASVGISEKGKLLVPSYCTVIPRTLLRIRCRPTGFVVIFSPSKQPLFEIPDQRGNKA